MLVMEAMVILLLLAFSAASVAVTISTSSIFKPFREYLERKGFTFISNLISCYYCLGHWVALLFYIPIMPFAIVTGNGIINYVINYFLLVSFTSFLSTKLLLYTFQLIKLRDE